MTSISGGQLVGLVGRLLGDATPGLFPPAVPGTTVVSGVPNGSGLVRIPDVFGGVSTGGLTFFAGNNLFKHAPAIGRALADACARGSLGDLRPEARLGEPQPAA